MDMKRILQALESASTKPVEGANDMKKFLQVINEGSNPHKVTLPVQMVMNHYQNEDVVPVKSKPRLIDKFFKEVEQEIAEQQEEKQQPVFDKKYDELVVDRLVDIFTEKERPIDYKIMKEWIDGL